MTNKHTQQTHFDSFLGNTLVEMVKGDTHWEPFVEKINSKSTSSSIGIHLAIFVEPYLQFILEGKKTIESRFSANRAAPYNKIRKGDIILLKRSGGPIMGLCEVTDAWFYQLDPKSLGDIRREFTESLCAQDPAFWSSRKNASFATLMRIKNPLAIAPMAWTKRDRRGWVILKDRSEQLLLDGHI